MHPANWELSDAFADLNGEENLNYQQKQIY
jgi:hypothetical protein